MIQTKTFEGYNIVVLDGSVNRWLKENHNLIKFVSSDLTFFPKKDGTIWSYIRTVVYETIEVVETIEKEMD